MAARKPLFDEGETYRGRVTQTVTLGPFKYLPRDETDFTGATLNQLVERYGADIFAPSDT